MEDKKYQKVVHNQVIQINWLYLFNRNINDIVSETVMYLDMESEEMCEMNSKINIAGELNFVHIYNEQVSIP